MGFRFRKSINLGGGFKINLSNSGVGYSWGVKGYRITKTAKGSTRTTASIPGTGVSYVHETSRNNKLKPHRTHPSQQIDNNHYDTQDIVNSVATDMVSDGLHDMLATASRILLLKNISTIGFFCTLIVGFSNALFWALSIIFMIMYGFIRFFGIIDLDYAIAAEQQPIVDARMNPMIKITECSKIWRIMQTSRVINRKYSAGVSDTVNRKSCTASTNAPFPFKSKLPVASFKTKKETLLFLPDKLFIIQGSKIGALNYADINVKTHVTRFVEDERVPKDSQVVGRTWKYVNKSGGPDRRFKNNKELPICLYGELELDSSYGLNTVIMFSNSNII